MTHPHDAVAHLSPERQAEFREFMDNWQALAAMHLPEDAQIAWQNPDTPTLAAVKEYAIELANSTDRGWHATIGDELLHILENGERP